MCMRVYGQVRNVCRLMLNEYLYDAENHQSERIYSRGIQHSGSLHEGSRE